MNNALTVHITTVELTAYTFLRSWFSQLGEAGFQVVLITSPGPFTGEIRATGARVIHIPISRRLAPLADLRSLHSIRHTLRELGPALVHTHTSKAGFIGRLAAHQAGVPVVIHTMHEPPHNAVRNPLLRQAYIHLERRAAAWADSITTVSHANQAEIERTSLVPPGKLRLIPLGIELEKYRAVKSPREVRQLLGISERTPLLGTVGRLEIAKGQCYLLEAMPLILEQVPTAMLVMVGEGRQRKDLETRIRKLGISGQVLMTGFRDDLYDILNAIDLFVLPSLWEGLGMVLLEAMAFKKPVVASRVGGVTDVVDNGVNGLLVPPRDPAALAGAVIELLKEPARRVLMGEQGRNKVQTRFRREHFHREMLALYRELLGKAGLG